MTRNAINPLDGRYFEKTRIIADYFSEEALMRYRVLVEGEYLIAVSLLGKTSLKKFTENEIKLIRGLCILSEKDFEEIKKIEKTTNHDIKAIEYFLKEKLSQTSLKNHKEWVHFALTSEDINNISYALILSDAIEKIIIPNILNISSVLKKLSLKYKNTSMLARTHGQNASPTTFGKEMKVFSERLEKQITILRKIKIEAKLNGATGNYNAHFVSYPKIDWINFSKKFIENFNKKRSQKLKINITTTQIECHDSYAEIFDSIRRINSIILDLNQDIWRYISDNWIIQEAKAGETGSSTMPHKINPIDFENSEGNISLANALFEFFSRKLPISRLQRDLSDSTVKRSFGSAFGYSFLAYLSTQNGLNKIKINEEKIKEDLLAHGEVIAEAVQTILRREGIEMPYEKLKDLTRGKQISLSDIHNFINSLEIKDQIKKELLKITPENYTGLASKIAEKK